MALIVKQKALESSWPGGGGVYRKWKEVRKEADWERNCLEEGAGEEGTDAAEAPGLQMSYCIPGLGARGWVQSKHTRAHDSASGSLL